MASGSSGNAYTVFDGKTKLLLDVGLTITQLRQALGFKVSVLDACLITHEHQDHSKGAYELLKNGIPVYASEGTLTACKLSGRKANTIKAGKQFKLGSYSVLPFEVEHDAEEPLGFIIYSFLTKEKLLYFTDTHYLKYKFKDLTHILGECNYSMEILKSRRKDGAIKDFVANRVIKSHMSLETFVKMLQSNDLSKLQKIYLIHLSGNNSNEDLFREKISEVAPNVGIFIG